MTYGDGPAERAAARGLLGRLGARRPLAPAWEAAFLGVPRHAFLPETVWLGEGLTPCSRADAPEAWLRAAYTDAPVVTQVDDGADPGPDGERWASSSASAPEIVLRMLDLLALEGGERVVEVGTGTGWNAGLLAHRLGSSLVTSVEVDAALAARARANLASVGVEPRVVTGDGAALAPDGVDRLVATCSVRRVPGRWIGGVVPGGVVLTPWESPWLCFGLLRLSVGLDGSASGPFLPHAAFMLMRGQRTDLRIFRDVVRDAHVPEESTTTLPPSDVTGEDWSAGFAIGLLLPDVWWARHHDPGVPGVRSRLWVATTDAASWAAVDDVGAADGTFTVWEHGPRRLWREVEDAYRWWVAAGRPGPGDFGMTVTSDGRHTVWLEHPGRTVPRRA
ncbi:methyltransferase domain-containing protein [Streptomyces chumphonensis]|uniref:Protein-L-isoaspartate O-methyltransferase n=1 Tax=Streptomyces chumphonensis TaxID=1214925 RepID=A0A927IDK7_9ACTN|nr:methyltransferase domain-containing protein [Streptomyces chumphonensis]MBD3933015.1 methyltransferase [Streptomyces chumphonensis]